MKTTPTTGGDAAPEHATDDELELSAKLLKAWDELDELRREVERLRELAATCYAGLGAACDLPEAWLDALNQAANGEPFSVDGLLPFSVSEEADKGPWSVTEAGNLQSADFVTLGIIDDFEDRAERLHYANALDRKSVV